ncbi:MAG: DUF924 domain-containing protein [Proteobacteria bacterium]|nr:DUF924 domain-containing protein [Pseudomonadota bacterium]
MVEAAEVLAFWFGEIRADGSVDGQRAALWWKKDPLTDETIRGRFEPLVRQAASGERDSWAETAEGRLALIICLDQFPRNIYRQDPRAWAFDAIAQRLCLEGLDRGHDQRLPVIQRVFHYMPLEHAEDRDLQQRCLERFEQLQVDAPPALQEACAAYLSYAEQHHAIIQRFGRFPHRNQVLGRKSTEEETAFLKQPGSSF